MMSTTVHVSQSMFKDNIKLYTCAPFGLTVSKLTATRPAQHS